MSENPEIATTEIATAETVAWGAAPPGPPPGPSARTWQAPAVIALFLVVAGIAAAAGVALSGGINGVSATSAGAPENGACRTYDSQAALAESNDSPVVPCTALHSAQTFAVAETLPDPGDDYRWSDAELEAAADGPCSEEAATAQLGLTVPEYTTTRLTVAFFVPTPGQAKSGARWVRCDHVLTDRSRATSAAGRFEDLVKIDGAFARCTGVTFGINQNGPTRCADEAGLSAVIGTASFDDLQSQAAIDDVREQCRALAVEKSGLDEPSWGSTLPQVETPEGFALCSLRADQWKVDRSKWPAEQVVDGGGDSVSV